MDNDFSRATEVQGLVNRPLKSRWRRLRLMVCIRLRKKWLELSSLGLSVRRERTIKSGILHRSVQGVVLCFVLFAHCFTTVHEWGSVELYT